MTAALATLNPAALVTLADCEQRIERGLKTFIDVGQALAEIRDSRLYRGTYATFEEYLEGRWSMSRAHAYRMISAAEVVSPMGDIEGPAPTNERQARALAAVPEPERAEVWREAVERTNGKPTAAAVRTVHEERTQTPGPSDSASTPPVGPGTTEADRHLRAVPDPIVPPAGSPATWTPEQVEANRVDVETRRMREAGRRRAKSIVSAIWAEISTVTAAAELGERGLVTAEMVAKIRESVEFLAKFVEVEA